MRSIKKPTAYVLCFATSRAACIAWPPQDASSQDSCKADTIVVPKHMQISMRRPLWRVITPYRYKGCVSCHSGDEPVVVVVSSFFYSLSPISLFSSFSLTPRRAVYRFYERPHKGQDVHGSLSLLSEDPIPSGGSPITLPWSLSLLAADSPYAGNLFWSKYFVETHVERRRVLLYSAVYVF